MTNNKTVKKLSNGETEETIFNSNGTKTIRVLYRSGNLKSESNTEEDGRNVVTTWNDAGVKTALVVTSKDSTDSFYYNSDGEETGYKKVYPSGVVEIYQHGSEIMTRQYTDGSVRKFKVDAKGNEIVLSNTGGMSAEGTNEPEAEKDGTDASSTTEALKPGLNVGEDGKAGTADDIWVDKNGTKRMRGRGGSFWEPTAKSAGKDGEFGTDDDLYAGNDGVFGTADDTTPSPTEPKTDNPPEDGEPETTSEPKTDNPPEDGEPETTSEPETEPGRKPITVGDLTVEEDKQNNQAAYSAYEQDAIKRGAEVISGDININDISEVANVARQIMSGATTGSASTDIDILSADYTENTDASKKYNNGQGFTAGSAASLRALESGIDSVGSTTPAPASATPPPAPPVITPATTSNGGLTWYQSSATNGQGNGTPATVANGSLPSYADPTLNGQSTSAPATGGFYDGSGKKMDIQALTAPLSAAESQAQMKKIDNIIASGNYDIMSWY